MRKLSANYIFTGEELLKNGVVIFNDEGIVTNVIDTNGEITESEKLEFYNGIICPGFVNTHCHLELSHMKGMVPMHTGLAGFLDCIVHMRKADDFQISEAIEKFDQLMFEAGIVACGDISNTTSTIAKKAKSKIKYHTFCEVFDINPSRTSMVFSNGIGLVESFIRNGLNATLAPHTFYTVTESLFELLKNYPNNHVVSIHNQETESENLLFSSRSGSLLNRLTAAGSDYSYLKAYGQTSLEAMHKYLNPDVQTLLVHNTFSNLHDIELAELYFTNVYWVLCPNSNLYIENKLPDAPMFYKSNLAVTLGTDSLASNSALSVLQELITLQNAYPEIPLNILLQWATLNGAMALGFNNMYGSFNVGNKPGANLLSNLDLINLKLDNNSKVTVLV